MGFFRHDYRMAVRLLKPDLLLDGCCGTPLTTVVVWAYRCSEYKMMIRVRYWGDPEVIVFEFKYSSRRDGFTNVSDQIKIGYGGHWSTHLWETSIRPFLGSMGCPIKDKTRATYFKGPSRITVDRKAMRDRVEIKIPLIHRVSSHESRGPAFY